jgi:Holliday junction resolvasome RuvABC DNA-binding subunit
MVVELRDKFLTLRTEEAGQSNGSRLMQDAVSALVNLGYRRSEAENHVREITRRGERPLPEVLKEALRRLSQ